MGCGPGDLAVLAATHYPHSSVVGIDVTRAMLRRAQLRPTPGGGPARLNWAEATALRLPFPDATFDLVMSAFVFRNLPRLPDAMVELRRVLRGGGTLLTLEITEPSSERFRTLFHSYFDTFVPWLGAAVGSAGPYRYLPESLRTLPRQKEMLDLMKRAGFDRVAARPQSLGIVTTYLAGVDGPAPGLGPAGADSRIGGATPARRSL